MTKMEFNQMFWKIVNREMKKQEISHYEISKRTGIKRTTFTDAKIKGTPLSLVNSLLVFRVLNIPPFIFTVKLIKLVEQNIDEEIAK